MHHTRRCSIEIHVDFAPPAMSVRRHGVPDITDIQLRESHHELTRSDQSRADALADEAAVGCFLITRMDDPRLFETYHATRMRGMRRITHEIKLRRRLRRMTPELHRLNATANIQAVQSRELVPGAIQLNPTQPADVDDTNLTALAEIAHRQARVGRQGEGS